MGTALLFLLKGTVPRLLMRMPLLFLMLRRPVPQLLMMGAVLLLMQFLLMDKVPMCLESRLCNRAWSVIMRWWKVSKSLEPCHVATWCARTAWTGTWRFQAKRRTRAALTDVTSQSGPSWFRCRPARGLKGLMRVCQKVWLTAWFDHTRSVNFVLWDGLLCGRSAYSGSSGVTDVTRQLRWKMRDAGLWFRVTLDWLFESIKRVSLSLRSQCVLWMWTVLWVLSILHSTWLLVSVAVGGFSYCCSVTEWILELEGFVLDYWMNTDEY